MAIPSSLDITQLDFPEEFIVSADIASMIVDEAVESHSRMWEAIDEMESHFDGEPPIDDKELEEKGLSWLSNRNFGKGRALLEQGTIENSAQVMDAISLASIEFKRSEKTEEGLEFIQNPRLRNAMAAIISNALVDALEMDSEFYSMVSGIERSSLTFGFCPVTSSRYTWIGDWHHPRDIAFEPRSTPDDIRTWIIFDSVKADVLYREFVRVSNLKATFEHDPSHGNISIKNDWIEEGLAEVLYNAYVGMLGTQGDSGENRIPETWEDVLSAFRDKPQEIISLTPDINIAKIYRREFDGSFSEVYIAYKNTFPNTHEFGSGSSTRSVGGNFKAEYLLFKKNHGKRTQEDIITIIRDSGYSKSGYLSELRGVGRFAYDDSMSHDTMRNDLITKMRLAQPTFEQTNSQIKKGLELAVYAGYNLMPRGMSLADKQYNPNFQNHLLLLQADESRFSRETEHFNASLSGKLTSRPTTQEVNARQAEIDRSKRGRIVVRLIDYSNLLMRMLKSLVDMNNAGKKPNGNSGRSLDYFYDRIKTELDLVPELETVDIEKAIKSVASVSLDPVIGDADKIERALLIAESPAARNKLRRMLLLAYGFSRSQINEVLPPIEANQRELTDQRVSAMENADMRKTREIVFSKSDDHQVHLDMHFSKLARVMDSISQGGDVLEAWEHSLNILSHTEKHVAAMNGSPFFGNMFDRYSGIQRKFIQQLNKIRPIVQQVLKKKQEQENPDTEMAKLQKEMDLKWFESLQKMKRTEVMQNHRAEQMVNAQKFKQQLEEERHNQKIRNDQELRSIKSRFELIDKSLDLIDAA